MSNVGRVFPAALLAISISLGAIACDKSPTGTRKSPLDGLSAALTGDASGSDTATNGNPNPANPGPGIIRGTVYGQAEPGSGSDSLANMPRLGSVAVVVYKRVAGEAGDQVASVSTANDGAFQVPELAGGEYVVTFTPPTGSIYRGVYAWGPVHSHTYDYPWFVVLPKR